METFKLDALGRFHRALVEEILRTRPLYLSEPFTVSEIYQNLVPYRTHRDRIGVAMNGDYEDVLLRLLAGEGEYLVLESEHARKEIAQELKAQNPNTGLYREYAAVDVRLNPLRMPRDLPDPAVASGVELGVPAPAAVLGGAPGAASARPATPRPPSKAPPEPLPRLEDLPLLPDPDPVAPLRAREAPAAPPPPAAPPVPAAQAADKPAPVPTRCAWCSESLPRRDTLNYCPFCGADLKKAPCPNCGEELEVGWRFCAACGTGVGDGV